MNIQPIQFSFKETHNIRIQVIDGDPWFCLLDVCDVLSIANSRRVNSEILDSKGVRKADTLTNGGKQQLSFVNEPNLYRVIFRSNKPEAKQFQDWVFNEVLPSIRKTGKYESIQNLPEAHEKFSSNDTQNLARIIAHMTQNFRFQNSWNNAIWYALRDVTGIPLPNPFEVRYIPAISAECERIWQVTQHLQDLISEAEKTVIKRIIRKREDASLVLKQIEDILASKTSKNPLTDSIWKCHRSALINFEKRM